MIHRYVSVVLLMRLITTTWFSVHWDIHISDFHYCFRIVLDVSLSLLASFEREK